jgi:hypothetical protein
MMQKRLILLMVQYRPPWKDGWMNMFDNMDSTRFPRFLVTITIGRVLGFSREHIQNIIPLLFRRIALCDGPF